MSQGYVGTPGKSGSWEFELYLYILEMEVLKFVSTYFGLKHKDNHDLATYIVI